MEITVHIGSTSDDNVIAVDWVDDNYLHHKAMIALDVMPKNKPYQLHVHVSGEYVVVNQPDKPATNPDGWLPISTAPLNEPVLVFDNGLYFVAVFLDFPYPHWKGRYGIEPSHWMKLPEPPMKKDMTSEADAAHKPEPTVPKKKYTIPISRDVTLGQLTEWADQNGMDVEFHFETKAQKQGA